MQCFGLQFYQPGHFTVSAATVGATGFVVQNLGIEVIEKPVLSGIEPHEDGVKMLVKQSHVADLRTRNPEIKCRIYLDNFNNFTDHAVSLKFNANLMEFEMVCPLACDDDSRFLDYTLWIDQTIKLISTGNTRHECLAALSPRTLVQLH